MAYELCLLLIRDIPNVDAAASSRDSGDHRGVHGDGSSPPPAYPYITVREFEPHGVFFTSTWFTDIPLRSSNLGNQQERRGTLCAWLTSTR